MNETIFTEFPLLESERLIYRQFNFSDAFKLYEIRSNEEVLKYLDVPKHNSIKDSEDLITSVQKDFIDKSGINWALVEKENNQFIGYFGFWRFIKEHFRAEIGYAILPQFWNKGFMSETLKNMIEFGFKKLHLHSLEANVNPKNESSKNLLMKIGFKKEAYFRENYYFDGTFHDSEIYSMLEKDFIEKIY